MKNLKLQRELFQQISSVFGAKPSARQDPLQSVLQAVSAFGAYDAVTLYMCADDQLFRLAHVGIESPVAVGASSSITAVIRSGEPVIRRNESQTAVAEAAKSQAVLPIRRGGVSIGALVLSSHNVYGFGGAELAMLKAVARRIAVFFATTGKHYLRNLRTRPQSDQSDTVTAAVA